MQASDVMCIFENVEKTGGRVDREPRTTAEIDAVFDVLKDSRRRFLLYHLVDEDDDVRPLESVVEAVREYEADGGTPPARQRVRTSLVHHHLPRLADVGVLEYDPRRGTVQFHGAGPLAEWLDRTRQIDLD